MKYYKKIRNVLLAVLVINLAVAFLRMGFGYTIHSSSMIADGVHALSDGLSNVIGLLGLWIASRPADKKYPYGYQKFETLAVLGIAVVLGLGAFEVLRGVWSRWIQGISPEFSPYAFVALLITIAINIGVVFFEKKYSRQYSSHVLRADSEHTISDLLISFSVAASLIAVKLGYSQLDAIVALAIVIVIARIAYKLVAHSSEILTDAQVIAPETIERLACSVAGVSNCHAVKTRGGDHKTHVDMHIRVNPDMPLREAHRIAHEVEGKLKKELHGVSSVIVHVDPDESST